MDRILLDTQAFVLAAIDGLDRFSRKIRSVLINPDVERFLSVVSITEIAIKHSIGKLDLPSDAVAEAQRDLAVTVLPFTLLHAHRMFSLPRHHKEPFDRMIIAVAIVEGLPIASGDRQFSKYAELKVIW